MTEEKPVHIHGQPIHPRKVSNANKRQLDHAASIFQHQ